MFKDSLRTRIMKVACRSFRASVALSVTAVLFALVSADGSAQGPYFPPKGPWAHKAPG